VKISIGGYKVELRTRKDRSGLWVEATCPVCGQLVSADDHRLGEANAQIVAQASLGAHMNEAHGVLDEGLEN
jgi:hypothetical protein